MPKSRKRVERHPRMSGIPAAVIALSPREWPEARRAEWCREYMAGAAGTYRPSRPGQSMGDWRRVAYQAGARTAPTSRAAEAAVLTVGRIEIEAEKEKRLSRRRGRAGPIDPIDPFGGLTLDLSRISGVWTGR